ncbi:MAG TPA: hypothetical protein VFJ85_02660 [Acidimicrobiales bacterium]|nr:hypothetical protein [Acidimicrobiales bacterium]
MATCTHGLDAATCQICRVLGASPPAKADSRVHSVRKPHAMYSKVGVGVVVLVVGAIVLLPVLAVVGTVLRVAQSLAVAALAGWVGWKLGVAHGRRTPRG